MPSHAWWCRRFFRGMTVFDKTIVTPRTAAVTSLRTEPVLLPAAGPACSWETHGQFQAVHRYPVRADGQPQRRPRARELQLIGRNAECVIMQPAVSAFCKTHLPALPGAGLPNLLTLGEVMADIIRNCVQRILAPDSVAKITGELIGDDKFSAGRSIIDLHIQNPLFQPGFTGHHAICGT